MAGDTVQIEMVRRYARILREQQARHRARRNGPAGSRLRSEAVAARTVAESAARAAQGPAQPADGGA